MAKVRESSDSDGLRLRPRDWVVVLFVAVVCLWILPGVTERAESLDRTVASRLPYEWSEDYWLYDRRTRVRDVWDVVLVGDSVVWGEFVEAGDDLASKLRALHAGLSFGNLGVNGVHPAAIEGLLTHFASGLRKRRVVLHVNLLWLSSERRDLSSVQPFEVQHPGLVRQFAAKPSTYQVPLEDRLDIALSQRSDALAWAQHLGRVYFDGDIARWTLENPRRNPLGQFAAVPTPREETKRRPRVPWTESMPGEQSLGWVSLSRSYQWAAVERSLEILRRGENDVFVCVGPFNEHLLSAESVARYRRLLSAATKRLDGLGVPYVAPEPVASDLYADASHPLAAGYAALARALLSPGSSFLSWLGR
ncbi:MAG: hypothetical protein AAF517_07760 [Planctomycetota bacterium]